MCKIAPPTTVKYISRASLNMIVPAVARYHYTRQTLVHPFTDMPVQDHVFSFKTEVAHENGKIVIVLDEGMIQGFLISDIFVVIDNWYRSRAITDNEHADISQYFEAFINNDMPVSALDQITSLSRGYSLNAVNWLMQYVNRVDLRGMIPPEWFYEKRAENMHAFNAIVRENMDPAFRAPSPRTVMVDLSNTFDDDFSLSSLEFSDGEDSDVIVLSQEEEAIVYRV
jgi:hypothetical protein